jgi:hypothetical protein
MKRALALIAAIAMIGGAFVVRGTVDLAGAGTNTPVSSGTTGLTVLCDAELVDACRVLKEAGHSVTVEPAGTSHDRLVDADAEAPDVWFTLAPWPAMTDDARSRSGLAPLFGEVAGPVAASPLVLVTWSERADRLAGTCQGGSVDLACVNAAAGQRWDDLGGDASWGPFKPGLSYPGRSSVGLAALAHATVTELGTPQFGTRSLADGDYLDWLSTFARAVPDFDPPAGDALAAMLQIGPASFDVAATTEAAALTALGSSAQRADLLRIVYPDPSATVDVVAAQHGTTELEQLTEAVADALADANWHTASSTPADAGSGPLDLERAAGDSLPGPGAHTALRTTFTDTVRR